MNELLATIVGGALAIAGGIVAAYFTRNEQRRTRRSDAHLAANAHAIASLQQLVRAAINIAYVDLPPRGAAPLNDTPQQRELRSAYERAVTEWNAAMYRVLLVASVPIADLVRQLDREAERVTGRAMDQVWQRKEFREERRQLGALMAKYLNEVRLETGEAALALTSIWSWADDDAGPSAASSKTTAAGPATT